MKPIYYISCTLKIPSEYVKFFIILQQKSSRDISYPILYSIINFNLSIYSVNDALDLLYTIINFQPVPVVC